MKVRRMNKNIGGQPVLLRPFGRPNSNAVLVVVHGGGSDRFYALWYTLAVMLDHGHAVVTAHLPGHGRGGRDRFTLLAARRRIRDLVALARQEFPGRKIVLLGQSLGASLALDAVMRGTPTDALIAVSPLIDLKVRWTMLLKELHNVRQPLARALQFDTLPNVLPSGGPFGRSRFPVRIAAGSSYVSEFGRAVRSLRLLERVRKSADKLPPMLVIHGGDDGIVPPTQARSLAEAANAAVTIVPNRHHLDLLFDHDVVAQLATWISAISKKER